MHELDLYPQSFTDDESVKFLKDSTVKDKLANAKKLSDVRVNDYDAIFYIGGHGPVIDLAVDPVNIKFASEVNIRRTLW
jgi:putative intracellular protease/amidase